LSIKLWPSSFPSAYTSHRPSQNASGCSPVVGHVPAFLSAEVVAEHARLLASAMSTRKYAPTIDCVFTHDSRLVGFDEHAQLPAVASNRGRSAINSSTRP